MVIGKKKRDVKFIIYQSLYILVIAMLGAKHVTINDIPDSMVTGDTIVQITKLDSLNRLLDSLQKLPTFNKDNQVVFNKPEKDFRYKIISSGDTVLSVEEIRNKDNQIATLQRIKVNKPVNTPTVDPPEPDVTGGIKGGRKK